MKTTFTAIIILFIVTSAAVADEGDTSWPMFRGTVDGSAVLPYTPADGDEINEWHFTSKTDRRYEMGATVWASPALAIVKGRPVAFIGGVDQTMHALDLLSKEEMWSKLTNGAIADAPAVGDVDGRPIVFWGSADRSVYAYVAATGDRWWTRELEPPRTTLADAEMSAPLLRNGIVYITCFIYDKSLGTNEQKGWLYALRMTDGEILWRLEVSQGPVTSPVGFEWQGHYYVYVAAQKGLLQAYNVSGERPERVWMFQMPHEVLGSPVIDTYSDPPRLFLGSKFGNLIAIDAVTGNEQWQYMAGNWVDNAACVGRIDGESVVYVGSHDYCVYAFRARDGELLWKRPLSGEVHSAPAFFTLEGKPAVVAGSLDNHLYLINGASGEVITSFYTGKPLWDKVEKGDNLWGSPAVVEAGTETAVVYGSFNGTVYVLPLLKPVSLQAMVRSAAGLWWGLLVVAVLFLGVTLPIIIAIDRKHPDAKKR